jgi:hypothetical protein
VRVLGEVIASDAAWLMAINQAIDGVINADQKTRSNPKALRTAYVARRAFSKGSGWQFQWCRDLYSVIQPQECIFEFNPNLSG